MPLLGDTEGRTMPARVFALNGREDAWVVEPPLGDAFAECASRTFDGVGALMGALEYAHATYGSALYLARSHSA